MDHSILAQIRYYLNRLSGLTIILLHFVMNSNSQVSYSCDMATSCGQIWDNNGFADGTYYGSFTGCGGSGNGLYDNVYGTGTSQIVGAWNSTAITGHGGGELTVTVKTRLLDYSSYSNNSSSDWGI